MTARRTTAAAAALSACLLLAACGGARPAELQVRPSEIAGLEALRRERPNDVAVLVRLGVAYDRAGDAANARVVLEEASRLEDAPPAVWLYLGSLAERANDPYVAVAMYERYGTEGGSEAAAQVAGRIAAMRHAILALEARRALEQEAQLALAQPEAGVVAVMPFVVRGPEAYAAIGRGLSEMLVNDLSLTGRLTVLDRARVQALLDEMKLGLAGYVDPATAARTSRLLRAQSVVQGQLALPDSGAVELSALVVDAARPATAAPVRVNGGLEQVFALELEVALEIYRRLGVELTPAELARLRERPTENLQAFLAYSRGLNALDNGDFAEAATRFREAASIDPGFDAATHAAEQTVVTANALAEPPIEVTADAAAEIEAATIELGGELSRPSVDVTLRGLTDAAAPAGALRATPTADPNLLGVRIGITSTSARNAGQTTYGENGGVTETVGGVPVIFRIQRPQQ